MRGHSPGEGGGTLTKNTSEDQTGNVAPRDVDERAKASPSKVSTTYGLMLNWPGALGKLWPSITSTCPRSELVHSESGTSKLIDTGDEETVDSCNQPEKTDYCLSTFSFMDLRKADKSGRYVAVNMCWNSHQFLKEIKKSNTEPPHIETGLRGHYCWRMRLISCCVAEHDQPP